MTTLNSDLEKYKQMLEEYDIQKEYKELITFIKNLQRDFSIKYPEYKISNIRICKCD